MGPLLPIVGRKPAAGPAEIAHDEMREHEKRSQKGASVKVVEFVAVAQIASMVAEPALLKRKDGYFCESATRIVLVNANGERKKYNFAKGTILRVIGGMLHLPPCDT